MDTQFHHNHIQVSESPALGFLLTIVGGFLDAYTYLLHGKVFANAQTGNIVLLGVSLAEKNFMQSLFYVLPILAFVLGVFMTELIKKHFKPLTMIHWRQIIVAVEIVLLFLVGFFPANQMDVLINVLISFICSMQVCSFKKLNGSPFATTMCTGNLRSATECLFAFLFYHDNNAKKNSGKYFLIIVFFIAGATLGTALSTLMSAKAVWVCSILLLIVFCMMFQKETPLKEERLLSQNSIEKMP